MGSSERKPFLNNPNRANLYDKMTRYPDVLTDQEVIENILRRRVTSRKEATISKALIAKFGSLGRVVSASHQDLSSISGLDEPGIAALKLVQIASLRLLESEICDREVLNCWDKLLAYLNASLARENVETVRGLFLDAKYRLIAAELLGTGTIRNAVIQPAMIVKRALDLNASALIIAHNHPSGDPTPSLDDIETTMMLRPALSTVGVELLDHIIVGNGSYMSFKNEDWLGQPTKVRTLGKLCVA